MLLSSLPQGTLNRQKMDEIEATKKGIISAQNSVLNSVLYIELSGGISQVSLWRKNKLSSKTLHALVFNF